MVPSWAGREVPLSLWEAAAAVLTLGYAAIFIWSVALYRRSGNTPSTRWVALIAIANSAIPWMVFWTATALGYDTRTDQWRWLARSFHVASLATLWVSLWLLSRYTSKDAAS